MAILLTSLCHLQIVPYKSEWPPPCPSRDNNNDITMTSSVAYRLWPEPRGNIFQLELFSVSLLNWNVYMCKINGKALQAKGHIAVINHTNDNITVLFGLYYIFWYLLSLLIIGRVQAPSLSYLCIYCTFWISHCRDTSLSLPVSCPP